MGQAVIKLYSLARREVNMFNLEQRAHKVISKDKPTPAPLHESTVKELERFKEENVSKEYLHKKDEQLDEYLKKVFVTSPDLPPPAKMIQNPERPLPQDRHSHFGDISYGYSESEDLKVPVGRVSLKQALKLIADHEADPDKHSNTAIAEEYKLTITATDDILEYFKMFNLPLKKPEVDIETLSTYEKLQLKIRSMTALNSYQIAKEIKELMKKNNGEVQEDSNLKSDDKNVNSKLEVDMNQNSASKKDGGENR